MLFHLATPPPSILCAPFHFPSNKALGASRLPRPLLLKIPTFPLSLLGSSLLPRSSPPSRTHARFSSPDGSGGGTGGAPETHVREAELELLGKPSPMPIPDKEEGEASGAATEPVEMEAALAPFLKFFKGRDSLEEDKVEGDAAAAAVEEFYGGGGEEEGREVDDSEKVVGVEYFDPKPGDLVVCVVVSGNEHKLDVNVGADMLGTMLTKEVLPLYEGEHARSLCDLGKDVEEFMVPGKIGVVKDEEALSVEPTPGRPVVDIGSVLFAEVLGRTLSGRPLLSTRRMFRRVAWHRVRQIKQLNEPIEVRITEWNTGGLLTRIEGLRAFLPKVELMNRVNNFTDLKENDMLHLQEGTLLEGTVCKIFPFGAQVRIGETNRSGLLHISNITRARVESVRDLLEVDEKVKVLVVKSMFPDKISVSIADLESEPGLFLSNKKKVFSEADEMAKRYKRKLPAVSISRKSKSILTNVLPFEDDARLYLNWKWLKFENDKKSANHSSETSS